VRLTPIWLLLLLPLIGLALLVALPTLDVVWENHPAHFWLVMGAAVLAFGLGFLLGEAAGRRRDARLLLVSLAFLVTFAFLGLHALATPGVVLKTSTSGFEVASTVGLLAASGFAAASALELSPETSAAVVRRRRAYHLVLLAVFAVWAVLSLGSLPPLDGTLTVDGNRIAFGVLAGVGGLLYGFAAWRYFVRGSRRPSTLLVAVVVAFFLLAEAMIAVTAARNWHATWWEWHLLMLVALAGVAWSAWQEWKREGSTAEIFSAFYEARTLGTREDLSVFFADLMGFTSYAERMPPAEVRAMLNEYFLEVVPAIEAAGGSVVDTAGDAVMAWFRGPGHELRAAQAGLAFQEVARRVGDDHPAWPRFRVGISSGEAYVGLVEARGARRVAPTGDCVNVAARIQAQARVGEVVIGEGTRRALGERGEVEDLGELRVKGRERPVRAFVLRELPGRGGERDQRLHDEESEAED
jgi:adenylate cyclase